MEARTGKRGCSADQRFDIHGRLAHGMSEEADSSGIASHATIPLDHLRRALPERILQFTAAMVTVNAQAERVARREVGRGGWPYGAARNLHVDRRPLHEPATDASVLLRRIDRDRSDADNRPALVEEVAAQNTIIALGHHGVEARMGKKHAEQPRRNLD